MPYQWCINGIGIHTPGTKTTLESPISGAQMVCSGIKPLGRAVLIVYIWCTQVLWYLQVLESHANVIRLLYYGV